MTIQKLLERLRNEHDSFGKAIEVIESFSHEIRRSDITKEIKRRKRKGLHWTQTPRGRRIQSQRMKQQWKDKKK